MVFAFFAMIMANVKGKLRDFWCERGKMQKSREEIGRKTKEENKVKWYGWIAAGITVIAMGFCGGIMSNDALVFLITIIMFGVFGGLLIEAGVQEKEEEKEGQQIQKKYEDALFYMACHKEKIESAKSMGEKKKIRLIAQKFMEIKNDTSEDEIGERLQESKQAAIELGKAYYGAVQKKKKEEIGYRFESDDELAKKFFIRNEEERNFFYGIGDQAINTKEVKIEKEKEEQRYRERFTEYYGRDKRIAMLQEEISEYEDMLNRIHYVDYNSGTRKEKDWAVAGGIASGLAGGAAGVATAINTQNYNAKVRDYNEQVQQKNMAINHIIAENKAEMDEELKQLNRKLEHAQSVLVSDMKMEQLKPYVRIKEDTLSKRETGTIDFKIKLESKELPTIYENKSTVLDGVVRADFCYNGEVKGTAYVPLTTYGLRGSSTMECDGMCAGLDSDKDYTMNLSFKSLWLMEA